MINIKNTGLYISKLRKQEGMTQAELGLVLGITHQAVSKWENGVALPDVELLHKLARFFDISMEELVEGEARSKDSLTYAKAGVDIGLTDAIKNEMASSLVSSNPRVLNNLGPFASLYDIKFTHMKNPVLVLKAEEPGSKQKLAFHYGYVESICHDMINHLVNDIIVMGATPLAVLDTIICSKAEKETVKKIVKSISDACINNGCSLVGGETSIQPGVIEEGTYILTSSIVGLVEKDRIIDGSRIKSGDCIIAVESNGLHTNGYSLVRMLMDNFPEVVHQSIDGEKFLDCILRSHKSYWNEFKGILKNISIHGIAHITGGGIKGNLKRILPDDISVVIDLQKIKVLPVFSFLKNKGNIPDEDMLRTFNLGVGMVLVIDRQYINELVKHLSDFECKCYEIGYIKEGSKEIEYQGELDWSSYL